MTTTTAEKLKADPDRIAPVSGARCRVCGHSAYLDAPETVWFIAYSTAYCCRDCLEDE